jgi:hypothetical protein
VLKFLSPRRIRKMMRKNQSIKERKSNPKKKRKWPQANLFMTSSFKISSITLKSSLQSMLKNLRKWSKNWTISYNTTWAIPMKE